jgi:hypothetical protein
MAIAASGAVSFSDLRTEFSGASAISFSDLYRGGTLVKGNAANNTATNLAASVPTSGAINFTNFRSTAKGWRKTFASGATNQNASTIFGSDYGVNYPKEIVINSGVTLGATSTSDEALEINTGGIGSITVTNNGTLIGAGGAQGAAGGDAFEALVSCTFINNGFVYAGGGGGGNGGNGGNGSYTTTSSTGPLHSANIDGFSFTYSWHYQERQTKLFIHWAGAQVYAGSWSTTPTTVGGYTYTKGNLVASGYDGEGYSYHQSYQVTRSSSSTTSTSGGSGGSGGVGAGYNQSAAAGSGGASGGTNAGAGGSGGTGAGYGASGSSGAAGANGNSTNGAAGGSGGAGGKYIRGISFVTFTNNGTVAGGTA